MKAPAHDSSHRALSCGAALLLAVGVSACGGEDDVAPGAPTGSGASNGQIGGLRGDGDSDLGGAPGTGSTGGAGDGDIGGTGGGISMGMVPCDEVECPQGPGSICTNIADEAICSCTTGYEGQATCTDINECARMNNPCGEGGTCQNFPGGYECACDAGYLDDAGSCLDLDECSFNLDTCDPTYGECVDQDGSFDCYCGQDTYGNGHFCGETDACAGDPCESGGTCMNTANDALCDCPIGTSGQLCSTQCGADVSFPDPVLKAHLQGLLGLGGEPIAGSDLMNLNTLDVGGLNVTSLVGLECAQNLEYFGAEDSTVADLAPFAFLSSLRELDLTCSAVTDLTPIAQLVDLQVLRLRQTSSCSDSNQLSSDAGLSTLVGLQRLELTGQGLTEVSALSALTQLREIDLANNEITSLAPLEDLLELESLFAENNQLTSLAPLGELPALREVFAGGNPIANASGLSGSLGLVRLNLNGNSLKSTQSLAGLSTLLELNLNGGRITDVSGLSALTRLFAVNLSNNDIEDFSPLLDNPEFGTRGTLAVSGNPCASDQESLVKITSRGMTVLGTCN